MDVHLRISRFDLGISISIYLNILRDIHMHDLDVYIWIILDNSGHPVQDMDIY